MKIRTIAAGGLMLMAGACAEKGAGPVLSTGDRYVHGTDALAEYRLGLGDRIKLSVYNEPTLSGEYAVTPGGTLPAPLIGEVPAIGRTLREVQQDVQSRLADGFLRSPKVSAEITVYRPFYIFGEVESSGQYAYSVGLSALNAIALAKGFTPRANRDVVRIRRQGESDEKNYLLTPELQIYPGDSIRVGERFF